jgi:hypothetical protein
MIQFSSHSMIVRSENDRPKCNAQDILGLRVVQQKKVLKDDKYWQFWSLKSSWWSHLSTDLMLTGFGPFWEYGNNL